MLHFFRSKQYQVIRYTNLQDVERHSHITMREKHDTFDAIGSDLDSEYKVKSNEQEVG